MIAEMQVKEQDRVIRSLSYACKIFASMKIDLWQRVIPNMTDGFAFRMRKSDNLIKGAFIDTENVDENPQKSSGLSITNIFFGKVERYKLDNIRGIKLKKIQDSLKIQMASHFGKNAFDKLSMPQKNTYSLLKLVSCAPLMTSDDVKSSLAYMDTQGDRKIF
jgi:hypothetical protein